MFDPVLFVSLGPGDPELLTLQALKALQEADLVFCPSTKNRTDESVSRSGTILSAVGIPPEKIRFFEVRMSVDRSAAKQIYREVATEVAEAWRAGRKVAITAEGDAGFYSTVDYIASPLAEKGVPFSRIAGVPAFIACGALGGISLSRLDQRLEVIPGQISFEEIQGKLAVDKTVVIMKASRCADAVRQAIIELPDIDFHYFENAGIPGLEFYTHSGETILRRIFPYFSLLIIQRRPV